MCFLVWTVSSKHHPTALHQTIGRRRLDEQVLFTGCLFVIILSMPHEHHHPAPPHNGCLLLSRGYIQDSGVSHFGSFCIWFAVTVCRFNLWALRTLVTHQETGRGHNTAEVCPFIWCRWETDGTYFKLHITSRLFTNTFQSHIHTPFTHVLFKLLLSRA